MSFRKLAVSLLLTLAPLYVSAQTSTLSGTILGSAGTSLNSGSVTFLLMNCGSALLAGSSSYTFILNSSGVLSGTVEINASTGCIGNSYYQVSAYGSDNALNWRRNYRVTGSTFNLATAAQLVPIPNPAIGSVGGAPGTQNQVPFNDGGGFLAASLATLDAPGNSTVNTLKVGLSTHKFTMRALGTIVDWSMDVSTSLTALQGILAGAGITADSAGNVDTPGRVVVSAVSNIIGAKCDGSTDDTAAFTTAFAAGGYLMVPQGKTCIVSQVLNIGSNTTLDLNGGTYSFPTSTGTILQTVAYAQTPTAVTGCSMTAGDATLTCPTGTPFTAAMVGTVTAYVPGANYPDEAASTLFAIITAYTDANHVTLNQTAYQNVASATVSLYTRNQNITIKNGTIAGNPTGTRNANRNMFLFHVDNLKLENLKQTGTTGEFSFWLADVTNAVVRNIVCDNTPADCIDMAGPDQHVSISNVTSISNGDDTIAIFPHASPTDGNNRIYGPIDDVRIDNISAEGVHHSQMVRMSTTTPTATMTNFEVSHIKVDKSGGVLLADTPSSIYGCYVDNIHIHDIYENADIFYLNAPVQLGCSNAGTVVVSNLFYKGTVANVDGGVIASGGFKNLTLSNINCTVFNFSSWPCVNITSTASIDNLTINGLTRTAIGTTDSGYMAIVTAASIGQFSFSDWKYNAPASVTAGTMTAIFTSASYVTSIGSLNGTRLQMTCGAAARSCNGVSLLQTGTIGKVALSNSYFSNAGANGVFLAMTAPVTAWHIDSTQMIKGQYLVTNAGTLGAGIISNSVVNGANRIGSITTAADITLTAVQALNLTAPMFAMNTTSAIIRGSGVTCNAFCTGISRTGSNTIQVINPDFQIDASVLTGHLGDRVYNTNVAFAALGPLTFNGATWQQPFQPVTVTHQDPGSTFTGNAAYQTLYSGSVPTISAGQCVDLTVWWSRLTGTSTNQVQWTITDGTTPVTFASSSYTVTGLGNSRSVIHICNKQSTVTNQWIWLEPIVTSTVLQNPATTSATPTWNLGVASLTWTFAMNTATGDTYKPVYVVVSAPY